MLPRALPVLLAAALAAARAAPATTGADVADPGSQPGDSPDSVDNTTSSGSDTEEVRYPGGRKEPEREGPGPGSARIFSQLVSPLLQLVVNQFLQATNLVGALAAAQATGPRPNAVLSFFSSVIGASAGGRPLPVVAQAASPL